ncbi:MAG: hypothetical protein HQM09_13170 [Candidatus Riflebacteria bacterium]|nr:hypothetical protein [Candidatus Riflebacteria bacterium]
MNSGWRVFSVIVVIVGLSFCSGASVLTAECPSDELLATKVATDYKTLRSLTVAVDGLVTEMDTLIKGLVPNTPLTLAQEDEISGWLFAFRNVRKAFMLIAQRWQDSELQKLMTPTQRANTLTLSFAALLEWYRSGVWCQVSVLSHKPMMKKLSEPAPELGIPAAEGNRIMMTVADGDLRQKIERGYQTTQKLFSQSPNVNSFRTRIQESYQYIDKNEPPLLKAKWKAFFKNLKTEVYNEYYDLYSAVSTWIGDNKYRPRKPSIKYDRIQEMKAKLQPGDLLLERENWYMSNIFLPGFWLHSILYVGTVDDLKKMGLTDNPIVAMHLAEYAKPDFKGHEHRVLESVSEGVIMSAMEEATDADYICALRPRLSQEEIKQVIVNAFSYAGLPYDFNFDFQTADQLACSELIYRSFREKLGLTPERIAGRYAIPSLTFAKKFAAERGKDDRFFDFVFFVDSDVKTQKTWFSTEDELAKSVRRPGFDFLIKPQDPVVLPPSQ